MKILVSDNLADSGIQKLMNVPEFQVDVITKLPHEELCRDYQGL